MAGNVSRDWVREVLEGFISFGLVTASKVMAAKNSVTLKIKGDIDADGTAEEVDESEWWGEPALLWRPADPDAAGSCEVAFVRMGDGIEAIGAKDRRWQTSLSVGQVVLRALAANGGRIRLNTDGSIEIGINGAQQFIALGDAIATYFAAIKATFDAHSHAESGAQTSTPQSAPGVPSPFGAVPAVKSAKHKVEQ